MKPKRKYFLRAFIRELDGREVSQIMERDHSDAEASGVYVDRRDALVALRTSYHVERSAR